ncbi:hypothetical protein AVEN_26186-1 [Araneus ventricosus]|uniref:Uncharacterized protein n=1 Tax=Araneus ventricosus TaxID=182803 RepID=A0A4Y2M5R0_ARAVE|nr:hypothetical protein AVEN_26186-1 [Araneus ventricosus]
MGSAIRIRMSIKTTSVDVNKLKKISANNDHFQPMIRRVASLKPESIEDASSVRDWSTLNPSSSLWCAVEVLEEVPIHLLSLSSDSGSRLQGPSQNRPHVDSKRDINVV